MIFTTDMTHFYFNSQKYALYSTAWSAPWKSVAVLVLVYRVTFKFSFNISWHNHYIPTCCQHQHPEKLVPLDRQVLGEGNRDEDGEGKEQGGRCESSCRKDWFEESRVTTARHHPIRPLFHKAGRAGQEYVFVGMVNSLRKKIKETEQKGGEKRQWEETCGVVLCCGTSLWDWESVTSLSSNKNNGGCRGRSKEF